MGYRLDQFRATKAVIHLENLAHNLKQLRSFLGPNDFFCPMVKANGYGHGDVEIALRLEAEGVQYLGVGLIEEGILLRQMGSKAQLLFFGIFDEKGAKALIQHQIIPVLSTWEQVFAIEAHAPKDFLVHLKFDTGMHRLGFALSEISKLKDHFKNSKLKLHGYMTHLHTGEDASDFNGQSFQQLTKFQEVEKAFSAPGVYSHTLNSAGFLNFLKLRGQTLPSQISPQQGVRPGLALYGLSPILTTDLNLKPAMSLRSETIKYHQISAGEGVSYNATWKAKRNSIIATIPIGYADGYHRALSNKAEVLYRGKRAPLVGNVCMDYIMIDVTDIVQGEAFESLKSESVTLFGFDEQGNELSAIELGKKAGTISWEILTSVGERVPRVVDGKSYSRQTSKISEVQS